MLQIPKLVEAFQILCGLNCLIQWMQNSVKASIEIFAFGLMEFLQVNVLADIFHQRSKWLGPLCRKRLNLAQYHLSAADMRNYPGNNQYIYHETRSIFFGDSFLPVWRPLRRASVFSRTLDREWTATGFLMTWNIYKKFLKLYFQQDIMTKIRIYNYIQW